MFDIHAKFMRCIGDMNLLPICETIENRKRKGEYELTMFGSTKLRGVKISGNAKVTSGKMPAIGFSLRG